MQKYLLLCSIIGFVFSTLSRVKNYSISVSYSSVPQSDECFNLRKFEPSVSRMWPCFHSWRFFSSRWEVIANYMNQHSTSGMKRTAKDVINKAKNLQRLGENLPQQDQHVDTNAAWSFKLAILL